MKIRVFNLDKFPETLKYQHGEIGSLGEYDVETLEKKGISHALYWYAYGDYEGSGQMLFKTKTGWHLHDMGHCSCYGAVERLEIGQGMPLQELYKTCSDELLVLVQPLFDLAKKKRLA